MEHKSSTYADLEALPGNMLGELIAGTLYASPHPATPQTLAASRLSGELGSQFGRTRSGPGGWFLLNKPELHFDDDVLVPDITGWLRERMPTVPSVAARSLAPDWVCEVLSASTMALDRSAKLPVYAREGVLHVWLVDPDARTLEVFRLEGGRYTLLVTHSGPEAVRAEPFEAIELELAILWDVEPGGGAP